MAALAALALAASCAGPGPVARWAQPTPREDYAAFLRARTVKAEGAINLESLSSSLMAEVLPYDGEVAARALALFGGDPAFGREAEAWAEAAGPGQTAVTVLWGLYAPDLGERDVTGPKGRPGEAAGRFRPRLQAAGLLLAPARLKRHGRDSAFGRDYFPVFNPWEELFAVTFAVPDDAARGPLAFVLEAPGFRQSLTLAR